MAAHRRADGELRRSVAPSPTQHRILQLAAGGLTDKEIAGRLGVKYRTVRTHLERLSERSGIRGRTALVAWYCRSTGWPGSEVGVGTSTDLRVVGDEPTLGS